MRLLSLRCCIIRLVLRSGRLCRSSAAIIWQAALAAGAAPAGSRGRMTSIRHSHGHKHTNVNRGIKCAVLTAGRLLAPLCCGTRASGIIVAPDAVGIFIVRQCPDCAVRRHGIVYARLMPDNPHSLAAAMLAGILLRFGLRAFRDRSTEFVMCGGMLYWRGYSLKYSRPLCVVRHGSKGITVALIEGSKVAMSGGIRTPVWPTFVFPPLFIRSS